jgi:hypothetical protein
MAARLALQLALASLPPLKTRLFGPELAASSVGVFARDALVLAAGIHPAALRERHARRTLNFRRAAYDRCAAFVAAARGGARAVGAPGVGAA